MELRKDYILDRWVIISSGRGKRPFEFKKKEEKKESKKCFFCPGSEKLTPPEIGRLGKRKWKIRWFPNKFAAVQEEGNPEIQTHNKYYTFASGYGTHEIIVETNDHKKQLSDLGITEIKDVLEIYQQRITEISSKENIKYVAVFKNHGKDAGTSLVHSHSQIIAYNKIPTEVERKLEAVKKHDHCPYCEVVEIEKKSDRRCYENEYFAAFTPYASRFHYEVWIMPKKHVKNITELNQEELIALAEIMKKVLEKLAAIGASYNMELYYSPKEEDLHFHITITPRMAIWGGFELQTGDTINSVSPEEAAEYYREQKEV